MTDGRAPQDDDARAKKANLEKLEAEARTAEANARKAAAEAAAAEATTAEAVSVVGQQRKEANAQKEIAVADKEAAVARRDQLAALIPDLSKVKASDLEVAKDGPSIGGTALTFGAIGDAAEVIAEDVQTTLGLKPSPTGSKAPTGRTGESATEIWILVTNEPDLASADGLYREVIDGLQQLEDASAKVLEKTDPDAILREAVIGGAAVVGALAGALPHVLSLLSTERAVSTAAVTVSDLAATAAVAGALRARTPKIHVLHDDFRLIHGGDTYDALKRVSEQRQRLVARKILLADKKTAADSELPAAKGEQERLAKAVSEATEPPADLLAKLKAAEELIKNLTKQSAAAAVRIAVVDSLLASIDAFVAALRVVPTGGRRSPLASAALHELMHPAVGTQTPSRVSHVLLIKSQSGTAIQMTENRPLWFEDKFSTMVEVAVTYMLIQTVDSQILDSDTVAATATAHGNIGAKPVIDVDLPEGPPRLSDGNVFRTPRRDPRAG